MFFFNFLVYVCGSVGILVMAAARVWGSHQCLERIAVSQLGRSGLDGAGSWGKLQARGRRQPLPEVFKGGIAISL